MMCGCGVTRYCPGDCDCGCDHDTFEGRTRQAEEFATQAKFQHEFALRAEAALDRVRALCVTAEYEANPWETPAVHTSALRAAIEGES